MLTGSGERGLVVAVAVLLLGDEVLVVRRLLAVLVCSLLLLGVVVVDGLSMGGRVKRVDPSTRGRERKQRGMYVRCTYQ